MRTDSYIKLDRLAEVATLATKQSYTRPTLQNFLDTAQFIAGAFNISLSCEQLEDLAKPCNFPDI